MLRYKPSMYVDICRRVKKSYEKTLCKNLKNFNDLLETLKNKEKLGALICDDIALLAVRTNNDKVCALNEKIPTQGGNIAVYNEKRGQDKTEFCAEYTMCQWDGTLGEDFIGLELILDWEGKGAIA